MKSAFALALCLVASASAQTPQFTDPANLRGERVSPRDGRELPIDQGSRGLQQLLRKLNTRASLMLIVAHPDDEDGGMLTFYSRGLGARVAVLTLTRGEGGQNAMTGDFDDALGLLRTQELLSADRYFGAEQLFGTEVDFGFSKTKEESFSKWTHERVLYDAVRSIRLFRPMVIAAVFIGGVTDGHGQHQVSGQIAQEAFKAAADPTVFPDMIREGILPWQASRVYARVPSQSITPQGLFDYATGQYTPATFTNYITGEVTSTPPSVDVVVHEGTVDPLLSGPGEPPRSYVQFARIGLGLQKSQIGGNMRVPPAGPFDVRYHLYGSAPACSLTNCRPEPSAQRAVEGPAKPLAVASPAAPSNTESDAQTGTFFEGMDTSLAGLSSTTGQLRQQLAKLELTIDYAGHLYDAQYPPSIAPMLADATKQLSVIVTTLEASGSNANLLHELRLKRVQLNDALALALNLQLDAASEHPTADTGSSIPVTLRLSASSPQPQVRSLTLRSNHDHDDCLTPTSTGKLLASPLNSSCTLPPTFTQTINRPYLSRKLLETPFYDTLDPTLRNAPASPPPIVGWASLDYHGTLVQVGRVLHSGDQPLSIVPPVSLIFSRRTGVIPTTAKDPMVWTQTRAPLTPCIQSGGDTPGCKKFSEQAIVRLELPSGWDTAAPADVLSPQTNALKQYQGFTLQPPSLHAADTLNLSAVATWQGKEYREGYEAIGYPGLPTTNLYTPATYHAVIADLKLPPNPAIGYLEGTGDDVFDILFALTGGHTDRLSMADLTPANLARFDAVVLGVRTYAAHPDLHGAPTQVLLDYARSGGNVVVQYQTPEFTAADAPFPVALGSNEKVVDETAPVQLLEPNAPFFSTPNQITPADFNNWVAERGHGFLSSWDTRYTALTETHDPGQASQRGGLITTPLGKGRWTYCAFALYRQLPEAVPGAFRLLVNLLNKP